MCKPTSGPNEKELNWKKLTPREDGSWLRHCRYKPEVRGFDSRWGHWNVSLT